VLFDHAIDQYKRVGVIADRVEDFIEKYHQTLKGVSQLTNKMPSQCFQEQQLVQMKRLHLMNLPTIQKQQKAEQKETSKISRQTAEQRKNKKRMKLERTQCKIYIILIIES
jgi:hypothetical protein